MSIAENTNAEIAPHPNVTIRHAVHAVNLLIAGAMHDIDSAYQTDSSRVAAATQLLEQIKDAIEGWEVNR